MKIKNLGTLHSLSSGKMVDPLIHISNLLSGCCFVPEWLFAPGTKEVHWPQSWLLSCSLWSLSTCFSHEDVFWKNRDEHTKSKISSLSWREIWHSVLKVEDWYVPTHILRRQNNLGKTYPTIAPFRLVLEFLCLVCHHLIHMYPAELCKLSESKKPTERPRPGHGLSSVHQVSCCNYADPFAKWGRFLPLGKRHSAELPLLLGSLIGRPMSWALNLTGDASKRWIPTTFSTSNHEWYWKCYRPHSCTLIYVM